MAVVELLEGYLQTLDPGEDLVAWGVRLRAAGFTTPARLQSATVEEVMAAGVTPRPLAALMVRGVVAGPAQPAAPRGIDDLAALLVDPEPAVLHAILQFYPAAVPVTTNTAAAQALYAKAAQVPRTDTRYRALKESKIAINGAFQANVMSKSLLFHAFKVPGMTPMLLKVPPAPAAVVELAAWEAIAPTPGDDVNLAGPITRVDLKKEHIKGAPNSDASIGLLMPCYPSTLQHVPKPWTHADAWRVGKEVLGALHHIHGRQRCYNDIKPSNVFLASSGAAHLGDFGAVRNIGGDADERTPAYLLKDQEPLSSFLATPAYDKLQLVMMLLDGVGAVDLEARHGERPSRRPDLEEVQKLAVELGADPVQSKLGVGSHLRTFLLEVMTGIVPEGSKVPVL